MVWNTPTRAYMYNTVITKDLIQLYIHEWKKKHIFCIMDLDYIEKYFNKYAKRAFEDFNKDNKFTKVHFILIRPISISKQITKKIKNDIRTMLTELNIPKSKYTISTETNFYIRYNKDTGINYRITSIPNSNKSDYVYCYTMFDKQPLLRIAGLERESCVDGIGMRYVIFTQGCPHHCEECQNQSTWNYDEGTFVTVNSLVEDIIQNPMLRGVTFSGGEPFMQSEQLWDLIHTLNYKSETLNKKYDYTIFTGFTLDKLLELARLPYDKNKKLNNRYIYGLLMNIDYIIDGRFEKDKKTLNCKFRGSYNQKMYKRIGKCLDDFEEIFPYKEK